MLTPVRHSPILNRMHLLRLVAKRVRLPLAAHGRVRHIAVNTSDNATSFLYPRN
jgi:hypothetical protein